MIRILLLCSLLALTSCQAQLGTLKNVYEKNGQIGIGTPNPDAMLTVKGQIHTQEVVVDLKGAVAPDYVFESYFLGSSARKPNYSMRSLDELQTFVKKYHHLPGIPSAREIESNGLALKEMNLLLLEKVEELTLYTIEQQKQIEALEEKVSKLEQ